LRRPSRHPGRELRDGRHWSVEGPEGSRPSLRVFSQMGLEKNKMSKSTAVLQVVVTAVNQIGEILVKRNRQEEPWTIVEAALPTREEAEGSSCVRCEFVAFDSREEHAVVSLVKGEGGEVYATLRPADVEESCNGPLLDKPKVFQSKGWTGQLRGWTAGGVLKCMDFVKKSQYAQEASPARGIEEVLKVASKAPAKAARKHAGPSNRSFREDIGRRQERGNVAEKGRGSKPADLSGDLVADLAGAMASGNVR
jgi:hypothetical protein